MTAPVWEALLAGLATAAAVAGTLSLATARARERSRRLAAMVRGRLARRPAPPLLLRSLAERLASRRGWHRRRRELDSGCEDVMVEVAEALRAGESLVQALARAGASARGPWAGLIREVLARYERGAPLIEAMSLLDRTGSRPARLLLRATEISLRAGGNLAEALLKLAQGVREERLLHGEITARTAEARWTAYCVAATPGLLAAWFLASAPDLLAPLLTDPVGRLGLLYAVVSWLTGFHFLRRLTRFEA